MRIFYYILTSDILPIFLIIFIGYVLGSKFKLDVNSFSKINFYVFVPGFIFVNIYTTKIPLDMMKVLVFAISMLLANVAIGSIIAKFRNYDKGYKNAFRNSIMFYNSGNIGLSLITLVFTTGPYLIHGKTPYANMAITAQIMVLLIQNISTNSIGFFLASSASMDFKDSMKKIFSMPTIYAIPAALLLKLLPVDLTKIPIWPAAEYIKNAFVPFALISLGAQLSYTNISFKNKEVYLSAVTRLLGGPIIAFLLIKIFGFSGVVAQALMISSSTPSAVNTALIAVEFDNCKDYASQLVMVSTLLSTITLTLVIYVSRVIFPV
ncbi:transporter [Thermoanaerobacterium sp. PSU-2]|uniref:AEC family transporter n=1 Tax=Thermoanaerobacterium sp. PSU-2 TaxID=1930849 RepID=UPI000A153903|nr:AEC family transporter [Thermoanaerobacterium sp. PSU-2]ORX22852.1 transporter [Thermoanaerobacterium sp. PSU-2]